MADDKRLPGIEPDANALIDEELLAHAASARAVLQDPIYTAAVLRAEAGIIERWKIAPTTALREHCFYQLDALRDVVRQLRHYIEDGEYVVEQAAKRNPPRS